MIKQQQRQIIRFSINTTVATILVSKSKTFFKDHFSRFQVKLFSLATLKSNTIGVSPTNKMKENIELFTVFLFRISGFFNIK